MFRNKNKLRIWLPVLVLTVMLAGCGGNGNGSGNGAASSEPSAAPSSEASASPEKASVEQPDVEVVLNWFAKSEHGGLFAAQQHGIYEKAGLNVKIEQGGPQVSSIQIVASGKAQFGLAHADQILLAREQGIPIVAVATTFQISPQSIMFHEGQPIDDFDDLNGRTIYIQSGQPYWEFLKHKYKLDKATEIAYTGQHANFIADASSASQSFVTGEPFAVEEQGVPVDTLLVADSGYKPYAAVIYTTEDFLKKNPQTVKAFVQSTVQGWEDYKTTSSEIDAHIRTINTNMSEKEMEFAVKTQEEFIYGYDAVEHGVGYMTEERWKTLMEQLIEIGVLSQEQDVTKAFTTEFLPEK
ncbi:ABC transporter substrate-binding protein [Paenibacillus thailandensis]|uniref:ABC transporter substrate-binding protein n=1 Tax=Paenibacillus thailandensis TaxID=393250 RepID=A0ABW5R3Q7_9BACL